tara:strand:+ start:506 stop:763 length:258 start_codon:yes stop_codon:yes gene_type:complete
MQKFFLSLIIKFIKIYKYLISPILGNNCRYLPTCSEYFTECLKTYGLYKGLYLGLKRILCCHPIKFFGGGAGLDFVPTKRKNKNG